MAKGEFVKKGLERKVEGATRGIDLGSRSGERSERGSRGIGGIYLGGRIKS